MIAFSLSFQAAILFEVAGAATVPLTSDHAGGFNEARVDKGLSRVMTCGRRLSPTFRDLASQLSELDSDLGLLYEPRSKRAYAWLRVRRSTFPGASTQVSGTIFVPLRHRLEQLGCIGHELHHVLELFAPKGRGPRRTEEIAAKEIARQITREVLARGDSSCL